MSPEQEDVALWTRALATLEAAFDELPPFEPAADTARMREVLEDVALRMRDNYPYPHPLYAGQMLKPPHRIARLAYALAMWINPNNHALDGGRASSVLEQEAVARLAALFGLKTHLGHLCGGGTMANLEALWVARNVSPGAVLASEQAHYTHERLSGVLGVPFRAVATDRHARLDLEALERALEAGDVGTVVVTLGATATGAIDPLPQVLALRETHDFRVHVDAAYGGYFKLARNLAPSARASFDALKAVDSIVIDPHKHGLQPYGCGCVLFRDPAVGRVYAHDSPYTYFSSAALHLGEISLECSRPGAAAVALWATQELLPYAEGGTFARGLEACRDAALALHARLEEDERFAPILDPELDIVVWAVRAATVEEASARARSIFDEAARRDLHLALAAFPRALVERATGTLGGDGTTVLCLRSCLMKPEHAAWLDAIYERLDAAAAVAVG